MKTKLFAFLSAFFLMTAMINAQSSETRNVSSFSELEIGGVFNVYLSQGNKEEVKIEAPAEYMDRIITKNDGNRLVLKLDKKWSTKNMKKISIYVTFKNLEALENGGVGNLKSDGTLTFDNLYFKNSAVGNTDLSLEAKSIDAKFSSVGNITLSGNVNDMTIKNTSVGSLKASNLKVGKLDIENRAVGSTEIYAEQELSIDNESVGSLRYKGNATIKKLNSSGIGKVKKM